MKDWYTWVMMGAMGWVGFIHLTGGGVSQGVKGKISPDVRNNPGSHRSHTSFHYVRVGGK